MNAKQKNKLASYNLVTNLKTEADPLILAKMPGAEIRLTNIKAAISIIEDASEAQLHHRSPASKNKKEGRTSLEDAVFNGASSLRALAVDLKNMNLANQWELGIHKLAKMPDHDLLTTAKNLYAKNTFYETELEPFNTTKEMTALLQQATIAFHALMPEPRENQLSESQATQALLYGFAWAKEEADHLDILVEMLRKREPVFHADYCNRRKVIKTPSRPITLKGRVNDSNGQPLRYVTVTIDGLTNKVRSTIKGGFRFRNLPDGLHILHFNLHGYREIKQAVAVNNSRSNPVVIELQPQ